MIHGHIQAQCEDWNRAHPVGAPVTYAGAQYRTKTPAFVTRWGSVALIFLEGVERPVRLDEVAAARAKGAP